MKIKLQTMEHKIKNSKYLQPRIRQSLDSVELKCKQIKRAVFLTFTLHTVRAQDIFRKSRQLHFIFKLHSVFYLLAYTNKFIPAFQALQHISENVSL